MNMLNAQSSMKRNTYNLFTYSVIMMTDGAAVLPLNSFEMKKKKKIGRKEKY